LDHKEVIPYSGLIIAVGGRPRIPEPYRAFQGLMMTLKTLEDARVWMETLAQVESALLVGGDFTSMAVCKALLHLGKKVTFMLEVVMNSRLAPSYTTIRWMPILLGEKDDDGRMVKILALLSSASSFFVTPISRSNLYTFNFDGFVKSRHPVGKRGPGFF